MTNYEAIRNMSLERMESFLDQVYLTGLNTGMYAASHEEDEAVLDDNPFDISWLTEHAEKATEVSDEEEDGELLNALVAAIFRSAGIPAEEALGIFEEEDAEGM